MTLHHTRVDSPIGELLLVADDTGLTYLAFTGEDHTRHTAGSTAARTPILDRAVEELEQYFAGERTTFTVPLSRPGEGEVGFHGRVQRLLATVPYGSFVTYKELAVMARNPGAVRAVGSACATNPVPIFSPCHRVLRTDGGLGGYRGGTKAKELLLRLENTDFRN